MTTPPTNSPTVLGQLTEEEQGVILPLQTEHAELLKAIGELEFQKSRILNKLHAIDVKAREAAQAIAARVGYTGDQMRISNGMIYTVG